MGWIEDEISGRGGELSFRDFMELALYHPEHGYYSTGATRIGRQADFLTAPTASRWYPSVLAGWCQRLAAEVGPLVFVDLASGDGRLIRGLLQRLDGSEKEVLAAVVSVERSRAMRQRQLRTLPKCFEAIRVCANLEEAPRDAGPVVVHASELYDAFPVHRLVARDDGVAEMYVVNGREGLEWVDRPPSPAATDYLRSHGVSLATGQIAEVNLGAPRMHARVLEWAGDSGTFLCLDYGYEASRLYNRRGRFSGSLSCYRKHELSRDPLLHVGDQDITAHVNWDDLRRAAAARSWCEVGLWPLAEFMVRSGLEAEMARAELGIEVEMDARVVSERQEIKRLLDPEGMGSDLKMLIQASPELAQAVIPSLADSRSGP